MSNAGGDYPSPSDIANGDYRLASEPDGDEKAKGWVERMEERRKKPQNGNASSGQDERARGRSLPAEQREREKDGGRRGR